MEFGAPMPVDEQQKFEWICQEESCILSLYREKNA